MEFSNDINIKKELNELVSDKLISSFTIHYYNNNLKEVDEDVPNIEGFELTTLENKIYHFKISQTFCYICQENKEEYESFEAILNELSPLYIERFSNILFEKLSKAK